MSVTEQEMRQRLAAEQAAAGARHLEALASAANRAWDIQHAAGQGLNLGLAGISDLSSQRSRASLNALGNYLRGAAGAEPVPYNPTPATDLVQGWYSRGEPVADSAVAPAAAVYQPTASQQELVSRALNLAIPEPVVPASAPASAAAPARTPDVGTTTSAPPATVTPVTKPAAATPAQGSVPAAALGLPPDGQFVVQDRQGLPVPMQCTSNVCSPDIQAGNFYANATQSGFASSGYSELDRYFDAAVRQELAGGPQGVLATEAADRAMGVQDLRMSPVYQQLYAQNLQVTGNDAQAAQALTDVSFRQAAATRAPGLSLGLAEQDITPAIDNLMSQRAGMALAMGDPRHMNPLSDAAESVGYYGGGGGLLYGTPDGSPAVLTQQGNQTLRDTPASYAAPSMARRLGVEGMLARADATEESAQRLLTAAAGSSSASNALTALRINNPEAYQQMLYLEALSRARGQAEGRGTPVSAWEQLLNLRADQ